MLLKRAVFLDTFFHGLEGMQRCGVVAVETSADGLQGMIGVAPGEIHGHLPRPEQWPVALNGR